MGRERRLAAGLLLAAAAGIVPAVAGAQAAGADPNGSLQGRWRVEFQLEISDEHTAPSARQATGEIAFDSSRWWGQASRFGRHSMNLRPFFGNSFAPPPNVAAFSAADTSFLTEVTGSIVRDSLRIDFVPRLDHLGVTMRGAFYGDSAVGEWYRRGADGSGRFVMRRVSREPVAVAAVWDGSRAATTVAAAPAAAPKAPRTKARTVASAKSTKPTKLAEKPAEKPATPVARIEAPVSAPVVRMAPAPSATAAVPAARALTSTVATGTLAMATPATPPSAARTIPASAPAAPAPAPVAAPTPTPARKGRVDPNVTGMLRVRLYDVASKRYVATGYQLHLADDSWLWGDMKSGAGTDGWGPTVRKPAGTHEVVIENFLCGDKYWFFANPIVKPVEIRPGETTDVTIETDLAAAPAKKTMVNKSGAACTAPPGTAR